MSIDKLRQFKIEDSITTLSDGESITTLKKAKTYGVVSKGNSKMPGTTFAQDAFMCITGSILALIKGTPCFSCYARRIQLFRTKAGVAWHKNTVLAIKWIADDPELWVEAMVYQILHHSKATGVPYHRWFDSGDLQSTAQLDAIIRVCEDTPDVKHWLPTQERALLSKSLKMIPKNLVIRLSGSKVDGKPPTYHNTSTVHTKGSTHYGNECLAYTRNNNCGECRHCWDGHVKNVSYMKH